MDEDTREMQEVIALVTKTITNVLLAGYNPRVLANVLLQFGTRILRDTGVDTETARAMARHAIDHQLKGRR